MLGDPTLMLALSAVDIRIASRLVERLFGSDIRSELTRRVWRGIDGALRCVAVDCEY
jgi:hypothetical protein